MGNDTISVLIVDDSVLMRNLISKIIEAQEGMTVAGTAMNGSFALHKIPKLKPDVIILDLEMPEMNGIEFLKERKLRGIDIPVVILSSVAKKGAQITMEALALGASDFLMKPSGPVSEDIASVGNLLVETVRAYGLLYKNKAPQKSVIGNEENAGRMRKQKIVQKSIISEEVIPSPSVAGPELIEKPVARKYTGPLEIIAIGISTGGPNALREVFANLDKDLPIPILVVQHMPAGFTEEFARSLDKICPLEVSEAKEGDLVRPGRVLIAPGNYHLEVEKKSLATVVHLSSFEPVNGHRPSADVLFASVAKNYRNRAMAVIMTGMGKDGAKEIGTIHSQGGLTIGQDEQSCVVFGMPKVALENGYIQYVVPLNKMAETINRLAKEYA
ncbi:MAG: chemotaxis response regulator protein-glutamate methylesterase [Spirochaetota bacterium]